MQFWEGSRSHEHVKSGLRRPPLLKLEERDNSEIEKVSLLKSELSSRCQNVMPSIASPAQATRPAVAIRPKQKTLPVRSLNVKAWSTPTSRWASPFGYRSKQPENLRVDNHAFKSCGLITMLYTWKGMKTCHWNLQLSRCQGWICW